MNKELIINSINKLEEREIEIAILEKGFLLEFHKDKIKKTLSVGDIYFGIVKKVLNELNAVIIDIGYCKGGFLSNYDIINEKENKKIDNPISSSLLNIGQSILVQISKEPMYRKGPKLTTKISIPGRNLVLTPFSENVSVSKKITNSKEKNRLQDYIQKIKSKKIGVIIRTAAFYKMENILKKELSILMKKWKYILNKITNMKPPFCVLRESNKTMCLLRDMFNNDIKFIHCNNKIICHDIKLNLSSIEPKKINIIKHYNGNIPIFKMFEVEQQINTSLGRIVNLTNGSYLIIEHTETLHAIDVNSGSNNINLEKEYSESERKKNILKINLLAATEISRQIILRDMGGIIIIDFIDMNNEDENKILYIHLQDKMKNDRSKHYILPPNEFGLVQVTRKRVRQELKIKNNKLNSKNTSDDYIYQIEHTLKSFIKKNFDYKIILHTHSFVSAYLKIGFPSIQQKWFIKYKKWIQIISEKSFEYNKYKISSNNNEVISFFF